MFTRAKLCHVGRSSGAPASWSTPRRPTPRYQRPSIGWLGRFAAIAVGIGWTVGTMWVLFAISTPTVSGAKADALLSLQALTQVVTLAVVLGAFATRGPRTAWLRTGLVLVAAAIASLTVPFLVVSVVVSNSRLS
jgi:hypothetical protein